MGQYSALSPTKLYRNLCPVSFDPTKSKFFWISRICFQIFQILTGVGFAIGVSCMIQSIVDMSVITWSAQAFYLLFTGQVFTENFFYGQVLDVQDDLSLDNLGVLHGQLSLCLGIACLVIFILIAAGTRSLGKVIRSSRPTSFIMEVKDQCKQEAFRAFSLQCPSTFLQKFLNALFLRHRSTSF